MDDKGSNKFNLRLSSLSRRQNKNKQDHKGDDDLLNILPSYHMYQSTISKDLTPSRDDFRTDPPSYEITPISSVVSSETSSINEYFTDISLPTSPTNINAEEEPEGGDFINRDNTILANSHKLKRLTSMNKEVSKDLSINIYLTEEIGRRGVSPNIVDPLSLELKQGDYIYGFVTVTNKTDEAVPFDMFSVILEGVLTIGNNKKPTVQPPMNIFRFLTMFDFNASWNDGCLDRLVTDHNNPHIPISDIDPTDNTQIQLHYRKIFEPNVTYKKFFTFKIPDKLLESSCETHRLVKHLQIPPTLGISKNEFINTLRQKWRENTDNIGILSPKSEPNLVNDISRNKTQYASSTNDLAYPDVAISYSISARVIGKASDYELLLMKSHAPHLKPRADEYVVANENSCYLRVIPSTNPVFELNRSMMNEEAKLIFSNMVENIKHSIDLGKEISNMPIEDRTSTPSLLQPTSSATELAKIRQSYYSKVKEAHYKEHLYEAFLLYRKKSIIGTNKIIGLVALSTPKTEYMVKYNLLPRFKKPDTPAASTQIRIPFDLTFIHSERTNQSAPDFKVITTELTALTIKSKDLPIPLSLHHDMLFENKSRGSDNFDSLTIKAFQKYAMELSKLLKDVGRENLDIDKNLIRDVKCLANLSTKYDHFKVQNPKISPTSSSQEFSLLSSIPWDTETLNTQSSTGRAEEQVKFTKRFDVVVDIANAVLNPSGSKDFCLVPDFQYCYMARLYYLKVKLKCPNGERLAIKVPLILQKDRD